MRDQRSHNIGMTGISLGGMHTWLAAAADERVAAAAPLIGVQGYRWAVENDRWHGRVESLRPLFDAVARRTGRPLDSRLVAAVWRALCPGLWTPAAAAAAPTRRRWTRRSRCG